MNYPALLLLATCLLAAPLARAEHEVDHRYQVRGYVLDENELPIISSSVSIRLDDNVIGTGVTNDDGYYRIGLHLHDPDLGRTLHIRTGAGDASITVKFNPGDKITVRRHYANFIGGKLVEERLFWREMAFWLYAAAAVAIVLTLVVSFRRPLKKMFKNARKPKKLF